MKNMDNYQSIKLIALFLFTICAISALNVAAQDTTPNSATLTWTAPGDDGSTGTASEYDIRYSTSLITDANWNLATQANNEPIPQPAGNTEQCTVSGLEPSTTYYFAIKTADEVPNWSTLSNVISKTTEPEDTPPSIIAGLSVGVITSGSIALNWIAPGDDGSTGTASEYDVRYSTSLITDANWDAANQCSGEPIPQSSGSAESFTVQGLAETTTYYFAIKTADEVPNWSGLSNVVSGTTEQDLVPPPAPVLVTPADGATDLLQPIICDWNDIGNVDNYQIQVANNAAMVTPVEDAATVNSNYSISGLVDGAIYYWRVRAHNAAGWGDWTTVWNFETECPIANIPVLVYPADGASNMNYPVALDWNDASGAIEYQVQVDDAINFASPDINVTISSSQYSASGLNEEETYYWRVRANNDCGWSGFSAVRTFGTADTTIPTEITTLNGVPGENNGEVILGWIATGDDGTTGTAASYDIRYSLVSITEANWSSATVVLGEPTPQPAGEADSFTVTGLNSSVTYYFAIKAVDESGNISPLSNVVSVNPTDNIPPASIMDLSAETGSGDGEVYIEWTASGDDGPAGLASAYLIKYSQGLITEQNWEQVYTYDEFVTPLAAGETQSVYMTGLEPGEMYYFGIKAFDENANSSGLSNIASCEAGESFVLDVNDEITEPVSPGSGILLHSTRPLLVVRNIDIFGDNDYYFEVASDSFFINQVAVSPPIPQQEGELTSWHVDQNLASNQTYYWRAHANNSIYSITLNFTVQAQAHAYPNPFYLSSVDQVTFTGVPEGANVVLTTVSGTTVQQWDNVTDDRLTWNGTNQSGNKVASGTYLWFVEGSEAYGKIVVMQ